MTTSKMKRGTCRVRGSIVLCIQTREKANTHYTQNQKSKVPLQVPPFPHLILRQHQQLGYSPHVGIFCDVETTI